MKKIKLSVDEKIKHRMRVLEMRMLRRFSAVAREDRIKNKYIRGSIRRGYDSRQNSRKLT